MSESVRVSVMGQWVCQIVRDSITYGYATLHNSRRLSAALAQSTVYTILILTHSFKPLVFMKCFWILLNWKLGQQLWRHDSRAAKLLTIGTLTLWTSWWPASGCSASARTTWHSPSHHEGTTTTVPLKLTRKTEWSIYQSINLSIFQSLKLCIYQSINLSHHTLPRWTESVHGPSSKQSSRCHRNSCR